MPSRSGVNFNRCTTKPAKAKIFGGVIAQTITYFNKQIGHRQDACFDSSNLVRVTRQGRLENSIPCLMKPRNFFICGTPTVTRTSERLF